MFRLNVNTHRGRIMLFVVGALLLAVFIGRSLVFGQAITTSSESINVSAVASVDEDGLDSTAITYQGILSANGAPLNDICDFEFDLYDQESSSAPLGSTVIVSNVAVTDGRFNVEIDFGSVLFDGDARWLEISVACSDDNMATVLQPRQPITAVPYAILAKTAENIPLDGSGTAITAARSDHDHLGQRWEGNDGLTLAGVKGDHSGAILILESDYADVGLQVTNAISRAVSVVSNRDGIYVKSAGSRGMVVENSGSHGVYVDSAANHGVSVANAGLDGLYVGTAVGDGVQIDDAGDRGVEINKADIGVYVNNTTFDGVYVDSTTEDGVQIQNAGANGVRINGAASNGLYILEADNNGVWVAEAGNNGVIATSKSATGVGIWGINNDGGWAGYFNGRVTVVGTLAKSAGSFTIDHPLDPENKYLNHSFVESPDMMNIYNGNVELDEKGEAWVDMPEWFEALNREFRYQLTALGAPGPNLYIAAEIADNRFQIAGGEPNARVSWQVTGIRHDPYAEQNRIEVEVDKSVAERGRYLHPELYNQPLENRVKRPADK